MLSAMQSFFKIVMSGASTNLSPNKGQQQLEPTIQGSHLAVEPVQSSIRKEQEQKGMESATPIQLPPQLWGNDGALFTATVYPLFQQINFYDCMIRRIQCSDAGM